MIHINHFARAKLCFIQILSNFLANRWGIKSWKSLEFLSFSSGVKLRFVRFRFFYAIHRSFSATWERLEVNEIKLLLIHTWEPLSLCQIHMKQSILIDRYLSENIAHHSRRSLQNILFFAVIDVICISNEAKKSPRKFPLNNKYVKSIQKWNKFVNIKLCHKPICHQICKECSINVKHFSFGTTK